MKLLQCANNLRVSWQVSSQEVGHDEYSTQTLARKQKEVEEEIQSHRSLIDSLHEQAQSLPSQYAGCPQVRVLEPVVTAILCVIW